MMSKNLIMAGERLKRIAVAKNQTPHDLAMAILKEDGFVLQRNKDRPEILGGARGYLVTFPGDGEPFSRNMRRSWLMEIAELIIQGERPKDIAEKFHDYWNYHGKDDS